MRLIAVLLTGLMVLAGAPVAAAAEYNPVQTRPSAASDQSLQRVIVKFRAQSKLQTQAVAGNGESATNAVSVVSMDRMRSLGARVRMNVQAARAISPDMQVMQVSPMASGESAADTLARLRADSDVEYAEVDRRVYAHAMPSDQRYSGQWYLQNVEKAAINAIGAWDTTTGNTNVVIAVLDTGVRFDHEDLQRAPTGRLLAGYDFVSADSSGVFTTANDGDGRDTDPTDPGDRCSTEPSPRSSWHGTRTSGIIGAMTNNVTGVSGITWSNAILPVRVLGRCGGFNSDVLAGMRWAAGQTVPGVPTNPNPAKILNISLGSEGSCDSASANVSSELASLGILIVVSAGNEGGPVDSPANCPGSMGVAGIRHAGTKVGYSSLGPEVALSAPAGNCVNTAAGAPCLFSIDTTTNLGTDAAGTNTYTDQFNTNLGTSFSAPVVSGIAGLMLAVNGNLKSAQLISRLKEGSKPFPTTSDSTPAPPVCHVPTGSADVQGAECICTTSVCGAGMANALGAVNAALRPIASLSIGSVTPGSSVTLQAGSSTAANGHVIASYSWIVAGSSISSSANASVVAPTAGTIGVCVTVTDDAGKQDSAKISINASGNTTTTPVAAGVNACTGLVTVAASDAAASESGDTGTFTLTRTGDVSAALTVGVSMSGTAVSGTDYQTVGSNVSFAAGAPTATLTVTPIDNAVIAAAKTVTATVQGGATYDLGAATSATVTIADNDSTSDSQFGNSGGGGGGALDWLTLAACLSALSIVGVARNARRGAVLRARRRAPVRSRRRG